MDEDPITVNKDTFWLIEPKIQRQLQLKDAVTMTTNATENGIEIQFACAEDPKMAFELKATVENLVEALNMIEAAEILSPDLVKRLFKGPIQSYIEDGLEQCGLR